MRRSIFACLILLVVLTSISPAAMVKGPYLIYPNDNTKMSVLWQLDTTVAEGCLLEWGTTTGYGSSTVLSESGSGTDEHQYQYTIGSATPLTAGTKYYYRVREGVTSGSYYTGSFYTAPAANATTLKFFAYGDTRSNPTEHNNVNGGMVSVYQSDPGFQTLLLQSGDWSSSGTESAWANEFFNTSQANCKKLQSEVPIQGCRGNHEDSGVVYQKYYPYPYVAGKYWSFDYGPAHFTVIDESTSLAPGSAQRIWLENDLGRTTKKWKFVMTHAPGYSAGTHDDAGNIRDNVQPLCEIYGVDIVFGGHNHYYARCGVNGVKHITTGGGGAPLYTPNPNYIKPGDTVCYVQATNKSYHFCKITIDGDQLTLVAVDKNGAVIDQFTTSSSNTVPDITFFSVSDTHYEADDATNAPKTAMVVKMNNLPGTAYPAGVGGGNVMIPKGVLVLGDLIDDGGNNTVGPQQWVKWKVDFGVNGEGTLDYPAFEGFGNHDLNASQFVQNDIKLRTPLRPYVSHVSDNGLHYSWDWERVHFIQLNLYPGDDPSSTPYSAIHDPQFALQFLIHDLQTQVGGSGRPVIIMHHFDPRDTWWYDWAKQLYYDAIKNYNVICIVHGHTGTGIYKWNNIDVVNDGNLGASIFVFHIKNNQLTVVQRTSTDTWNLSLQKTFLFPAEGGQPAWNPSPADDPTGVKPVYAAEVKLSWSPGAFDVNAYDVYFGTNFTDVNNGTGGTYLGNQPADQNSYGPMNVSFNTTYYWRIDQVDDLGAVQWKGKVWTFKIADYALIENFESYANTSALASVWSPAGSTTLSLETTIIHGGSKSMKTGYSSTAAEASRPITASDWTAANIKALTLWYRGEANIGSLYVRLESNNGAQTGTLTSDDAVNESGDPVDVKAAGWHQMNFDLSLFGIDLTNVTKIVVGIVPETGMSGQAYWDDIRLYPTRVLQQMSMDFNGDNYVDFVDYAIFANEWFTTNMYPATE